MSDFFGCGFARVAVKLSMLKSDGKVEHNNEARWKRYVCHFESLHNERFAVENRKFFHKRAKILSLNYKRWKTKDKSQYIDHFSHENWKNLAELEKKQHRRVDCQACAVHHYKFQTLFPSWGRKGSTGLHTVVNRTKEHVLKPSNSENVKPTLKAITKAAHKIYNEINRPFKERFGMSFAKAQTKTPELGLQEKKSTAQLKKERREKLRQEKKLIEGEWSKRDCDTMLATRQTYKQRQEQRLALFLRPQMKPRTGLPKESTWKSRGPAKESDTLQTQMIWNLTKMDS